MIAAGRKLGASRKLAQQKTKRLSSTSIIKPISSDTVRSNELVAIFSESHYAEVVQFDQKANEITININKFNYANKYHRSGDLAISDRALNQSVDQLREQFVAAW